MISTKTYIEETCIMKDSKPVWKDLCTECSSAAKKVGIDKKTTRKILKDIREKNNL